MQPARTPADPDPPGASAAGDPTAPVRRLRGWLFGLLFLGIAGLAAELALLDHNEKPWQWVPFAVLGAAAAAALFHVLKPGPLALGLFRAVMAVLVAAGVAGLYLHYKGNVEFELEMRPTLAGAELFWKAVKGATPALAPLALAHLGLLGWVCTSGDPLGRRRLGAPGQRKEDS